VTDGVGLASEVASTRGGSVVRFGVPSAGASALSALLDDPAARRVAGDRGRARVEREYLLDAVARRAAAVYDELTAGRRRPARAKERVA
jgi:glycosyltransferase involved in cell wall biosynthesis